MKIFDILKILISGNSWYFPAIPVKKTTKATGNNFWICCVCLGRFMLFLLFDETRHECCLKV